MKIEKVVENLGLVQRNSMWSAKKSKRNALESKFKNYTGHIDIVECHFPYPDLKILKGMMNETSKLKGNKMLVLNGDVQNQDIFSRFKDQAGDRSKPLDELEMLIKFLKYASKIYTYIIFVTANHDSRMYKIIGYLSSDTTQADQIRGFMKTIEEIFEERGLDIIVSPQYLFQVGDAIMCHMEKNHRNPHTTAMQIWEDLTARMSTKWNVVFQSHTHRQSQHEINKKRIIMTGAVVNVLDYSRSGKLRYTFSSIGYGVCDMRNGKADLDKTTYRVRGYEDPL